MPGDRRRFAVAYLCSIVVHGIALLLLALFVLRVLVEGGAPESVIADTRIIVRTETAPPVPVLRPRPVATVKPKPPVPRELARIVPKATPQPPTPPPAVIVERLLPTPVPTVVPTVLPAVAPTVRPTVAPTVTPTVAPTVRPTVAPTIRPTPEPTARPTPEPTPEVTSPPTAIPTARATLAPSPAATAVAERPAAAPAAAISAAPASPAPARVAIAATPLPAPVHVAVALVPPTAAPSAAPSGGALARLNERLRAALPTTPTATMAPVNLNGGYSSDGVLSAYEATLAPPLEVLAKTFGLIYTTRTISRADSVTYVYERTHNVILGHDICRAFKITEHPLREAYHPTAPVGPGVVEFPGPLRDVKPELENVDVPCDAKGLIDVVPGSLKSPVPRRQAPP
jgi:hypothetical protein